MNTNSRCSRCHLLKPLSTFRWLKKSHRGRNEKHRDSWCANCRRAYKTTADQRHKHAARQRERRKSDPIFRQKCIDAARAYYRKNKPAVLKRQKLAVAAKYGGGSLQLGYVHGRLRKFGLTLSVFQEMCRLQDDRCACCGIKVLPPKRRLAVDHDHATGRNRGLLCHHCNTGLGNFFDSPLLLIKAIEYLSRYSNRQAVS